MTGLLAHDDAQRLRSAIADVLGSSSDTGAAAADPTRTALFRVLDVLESSSGAVVLPADAFVTTQQAAELLGVSRMTVVRLIDRGVRRRGRGVHRRIAAAGGLTRVRNPVRSYQHDRSASLDETRACSLLIPRWGREDDERMSTPDGAYAKPFLTIPEQIRRLRGRGMDCGADEFASGVLERYGYYRLSGYWHLYRARPEPPAARFGADGREIRLDSFVPKTRLAHVVALYEFDHGLPDPSGRHHQHGRDGVSVPYRSQATSSCTSVRPTDHTCRSGWPQR